MISPSSKTAYLLSVCLAGALPAVLLSSARSADDGLTPSKKTTVRVGAVQARPRIIDYKLSDPADVLKRVDTTLDELERIIHKAGEAKCDALAFPEDTLGLLHWEGMNKETAKPVLSEAVQRMLDRLGRPLPGEWEARYRELADVTEPEPTPSREIAIAPPCSRRRSAGSTVRRRGRARRAPASSKARRAP